MKSKKLLESFTAHCKRNPDLRFWQALCNWCGWHFVLVRQKDGMPVDTFYWESNEKPDMGG